MSDSEAIGMNDIKKKLEAIQNDFACGLEEVTTVQDILNLKANFLGKKGPLTQILAGLKNLNPDERKIVGPASNEAREKISEMVNSKIQELEIFEINEKLSQNRQDITNLPQHFSSYQGGGAYHPRFIIGREIEDVFLSMGFEILDGPHIDDEFHNFEALNIPGDHPARDMQDTFWFVDPKSPEGKKHLLRTHTSTLQIRGMLERKPPFRFIAPGTVFRSERTDASHEMVFNQLEGMMVGENISVAHLIYFMKTVLREIFKREVKVRLRPGFFPFVEPGFELDVNCLICSGKGCSVCKHTGWLELLPCGMVHPNVLKAGGIDTRKYNGFAFGLGLDRLVMMKYAIDDIRHLQSGDLRFNEQFKIY